VKNVELILLLSNSQLWLPVSSVKTAQKKKTLTVVVSVFFFLSMQRKRASRFSVPSLA